MNIEVKPLCPKSIKFMFFLLTLQPLFEMAICVPFYCFFVMNVGLLSRGFPIYPSLIHTTLNVVWLNISEWQCCWDRNDVRYLFSLCSLWKRRQWACWNIRSRGASKSLQWILFLVTTWFLLSLAIKLFKTLHCVLAYDNFCVLWELNFIAKFKTSAVHNCF